MEGSWRCVEGRRPGVCVYVCGGNGSAVGGNRLLSSLAQAEGAGGAQNSLRGQSLHTATPPLIISQK